MRTLVAGVSARKSHVECFRKVSKITLVYVPLYFSIVECSRRTARTGLAGVSPHFRRGLPLAARARASRPRLTRTCA